MITDNGTKQYWLLKSEPDVFSIDDLERDGTTPWEGVRNYLARNYMMAMQPGDLAIFYHSSTTPPGAAGVMEVATTAAPDKQQFDTTSDYFDEKATLTTPRWFCVEFKFVQKFAKIVTLDEMKKNKKLKDMVVLRRGNRLSITPLTKSEFEAVEQAASP